MNGKFSSTSCLATFIFSPLQPIAVQLIVDVDLVLVPPFVEFQGDLVPQVVGDVRAPVHAAHPANVEADATPPEKQHLTLALAASVPPKSVVEGLGNNRGCIGRGFDLHKRAEEWRAELV